MGSEFGAAGRKGGIKGDLGRRDRLAAELRANLMRRKARTRKLAAAGEEEAGTAAMDPAADREGSKGSGRAGS
jgi:hypothetical protein